MEILKLRGEPNDVDRIWLLSIKHSGTHYMYMYLELLGYQRCIVFWETLTQKHPTNKQQFIHAHLEVGHEYSKFLTNEKCVMPLRDPVEVFKTHVYRYKWDENEYLPYILNAFERFRHVIENYNAFVFRVDKEDQLEEVNRLGEFLNSRSWTYKEQANNIATSRTRPVTMEQGFLEQQVKLFANPPKEILELSAQFGY